MFNTLFILHNPVTNRYWTQLGNHTKYSECYRIEQKCRRVGDNFQEIEYINLPSEEEARDLQRAVNEIFKVWTALTEQMVIDIQMKPKLFISFVKYINKYKYDDDKMLEIFDKVTSLCKHHVWYGQVYFIECDNDKLKIGETSSMSSRWDNLKEESQNKAKDIIEVVYSKDRLYDEAKLHLLCRGFKADGNKERTDCKQSRYLSELFANCKEVRDIWNKYTENMNRLEPDYLQYILTGVWPKEDN